MAHFAKLDADNIVTSVVVTDNNAPNEGFDWLVANFGGRWVKTSYNTFGNKHKQNGIPLRKNFAGIGFSYDEQRDAFIPPKPFDSWILDEETCLWEAPVSYPTDGKHYLWDEPTISWKEVTSN